MQETNVLLVDMEEDYEHFKKMWSSFGNLDEQELKELLNFSFEKNPESIEEQVRYYFLRLKTEEPKQAKSMMKDLTVLLRDGVNSLGDIEKLCLIIGKYWHGFVVHYGEESYTVDENRFGYTF